MAAGKKLKKFEGREVIGTSISVTNAGDGLSANMAIEPTELQHDQEVIVVLRTRVSKVQYTEVKDTASLIRNHTLKAGTAIILDDPTAVADILAAQEAKLEEARQASKLDFADGTEGGDED